MAALLPLLGLVMACGTSESTREANGRIRGLEARVASLETLLAAEESDQPAFRQQGEIEGIVHRLNLLIEGLELRPELRLLETEERDFGNNEDIIHRLDIIIEGLELHPELRPRDFEPQGETEGFLVLR